METKSNESQISNHPFAPFIPFGATKLIIGTIPPERFCIKPQKLLKEDVNFYYGSQDNDFWELLGKVFSVSFDFQNTEIAIKQRTDILTKQGLGITDLIDTCQRNNGRAADKDLINITYKNLSSLLSKHNEINTLIYTSEFVKTLINKIFSDSKVYHNIDKTDKKKQSVILSDKLYQVRILYSPAPIALWGMGENGAEIRLQQYYNYLK